MKLYVKASADTKQKKNRGQTEKVWDAKAAAQQVATAMQDNIDDGIMDFEFEIDTELDNDRFWSVLDSIVKSIGISYSVKSSDKEFDDHYYYCYLYGNSKKIESASSSNYHSVYNAAKQRILDCIASPTKRVAVVFKPHERSLDEDARERIIHNLYGDDDIIEALADADVYGLITNQSDPDGSYNGGARFWKSKKKTNWGGGQEL